jgi:hypothetical protein
MVEQGPRHSRLGLFACGAEEDFVEEGFPIFEISALDKCRGFVEFILPLL